jgi:hypothetical protein
MAPRPSPEEGKLHCHKFDRWVDAGDAVCSQPDDYCDARERCAIYFLMIERVRSVKKRTKEERDASL